MIRFLATYYDGQSSRPHPVKVEVFEAGPLVVDGPDVRREVAPDDVRLAARLGNTARSLTFRDGAKCETRDNDAVDELARRWGRSSSSALRHKLESSWRAVVAATSLLAVVFVVGVVWGIPLAAKVVAARIPDAVAYRVGEGTLDLLDQSLFEPTALDEEEQARVRAAFDEMAALEPELPLTLAFRQLGLPNAFALPDGTVVITDELVALAEDDAELQAVIAHELGHVHHRHALRMALESSSVALLVSAYLGDVSQLSTLLGAMPAVYAEASFSREHETEADTFALALLERADLEPAHFAHIMSRLTEEMGGEAESSGALAFLASHPPTEERIARFVKAGAEEPPPGTPER